MSDLLRFGLAALMLAAGLARGHALAQEPLPPGHPPVPAGAQAAPTTGSTDAPALPPGHVPTGGSAAGALPPGHVPTGGSAGAMPPGHPAAGAAASGSMGRLQQVLRPPSSPVAVESDEVPVGAIRVTVVDESGQPVADQAVDVGALASGERSRHNARTDRDGVALFTDLPTGTAQHYRVNVPYLGATYSTMPFALTTEHGHAVRVVRHPVTQDDAYVFFHIFRVVVEQRGERMHVIHQGELTNAGESTYVFPASGLRAALPEGALAFQFQRVITDQRVEELDGQHAYVIRGSLPPGTVRLAWAYDVPVAGGDLDIPVEIPLRFFGIQVIAEALPELGVSIRGLPAAQRLDTQGNPCTSSLAAAGCAWVTQMQRGPDDPPIHHLTIHLTGIPGPGPVRWVAVVFAGLFLLIGALWFITSAGARTAASSRREELEAEAEALKEEFEQGEIGPEYFARRRAEIVRELAGHFYASVIEEAAKESQEASGRSHRPGPLGYLLPADGAAPLARYVELALTVLSSPLLLLGLVFFSLRPRAMGSLGGQAEIAVNLVLGLCGVAGILALGETVHWDLAVSGAVVAVTGLSLALRTIVRTAAPRRSTPAPA